MSSPRPPTSLAALTDLGRVRLSEHFFMRDMLYSEVGNCYGQPNIPEDPETAIAAGRKLASLVLEPLLEAFGHIAIRSAYRSSALNGYCHDLYKSGVTEAWCTCNEDSAAEHIWDRRDAQGYLGATATVVVPAYLEFYERTQDWRPLAWWIRDNLKDYAQVQFFRTLCAFNIRWYEGPSDRYLGYLDPPQRVSLTALGEPGFEGDHAHHYAAAIQTQPATLLRFVHV